MPKKEVPVPPEEAKKAVPVEGYYLILKAKYGAMFEAMGRVD